MEIGVLLLLISRVLVLGLQRQAAVLLEAVEYPSWELLAPRVSERRVLPTSGVPTWLLTLRYCTLPPLIMAAFLVHFCWVWSPLCTKQKSAISIEKERSWGCGCR